MKFEEYLMDMLDHVQMKACDTKLQQYVIIYEIYVTLLTFKN